MLHYKRLDHENYLEMEVINTEADVPLLQSTHKRSVGVGNQIEDVMDNLIPANAYKCT